MKNYRSFLNDENAGKKLAVLCVVIAVAALGLADYFKSSSENSDLGAQTTVTVSETAQVSETAPALVLTDKYIPFECSKSDYMYLGGVAKYKSAVFRKIVNGGALLYSDTYTGARKFLFPVPDYENRNLSVAAYIKDSLYFRLDNALYKLEVGENGDCDLNNLSLVVDLNAVPVYLEGNKMLLKVKGGEESHYVLLHTLTGEWEKTEDYNIQKDGLYRRCCHLFLFSGGS